MDIDGFMRSLTGLDRYMTEHTYKLEPMELVDKWNYLVIRRQKVKGIEEQGNINL
jgi:hypothetical protein